MIHRKLHQKKKGRSWYRTGKLYSLGLEVNSNFGARTPSPQPKAPTAKPSQRTLHTTHSMLALRPSCRGVRLHTFEPEERAYTSTPTKIGGHCLDHVRNGLTLTLSSPTAVSIVACPQQRDDREPPAAASSTFDPKGRFGGLCGVVLRPSPSLCSSQFGLPHQLADRPRLVSSPQHARLPPQRAPFLMPLCSTPRDLPPDTLAGGQDIAIATDAAVAWQQKGYGPEWPAQKTAAAPICGSTGVLSGEVRERHHNQAITTATRHTGALMAVLLSKFANGNGASSSSADERVDGATLSAAAASDAATADVHAAIAAAPSRTELHRSVDNIAQDLLIDDASSNGVVNDSVAKVGRRGSGGSWAWKARVDQAPTHSKLRRYIFVRELGKGSHGTALLVRKKSAGGGNCNMRNGDDMRVLKESQLLPEAVNEARLLLLAGSGVQRTGWSQEKKVVDDGGGPQSCFVAAYRGSKSAFLGPKPPLVNSGHTGGTVGVARAVDKHVRQGQVVQVRDGILFIFLFKKIRMLHVYTSYSGTSIGVC